MDKAMMEQPLSIYEVMRHGSIFLAFLVNSGIDIPLFHKGQRKRRLNRTDLKYDITNSKIKYQISRLNGL